MVPVFNMDCLDRGSEMRPLVSPERKHALLMTQIIRTIVPSGEIVLRFCKGTGLNAKSFLLAPKRLKIFG